MYERKTKLSAPVRGKESSKGSDIIRMSLEPFPGRVPAEPFWKQKKGKIRQSWHGKKSPMYSFMTSP